MSGSSKAENSAKSIFLAALQITSEVERSRFVEHSCTHNPTLHTEVEKLLSACNQDHSNLFSHAVKQLNPLVAAHRLKDGESLAATCDHFDVAEHPVIDRYKLLEEIGHGGMGTVYMAQQLEPVKRRVALKVINPGMDSREVIARFEAERQALAMMDHPHIARVLDAGTTDQGRPYFVMELVRGVPITDYCQQQQLGLEDRLRLFTEVCQAVQHAHQKGIIHRDLKPSNVMVSDHDGEPVVKVIDFGVAKALHQELTAKTLFTKFSQLVGTPLYMSPEQAQLSGLDVDTRSDVYALGVLLYELLTGTTPFDRETLAQAGIDAARRIICEEVPPRPSTRLSTLHAVESTLKTSSPKETKHVELELRDELDWIVMKALEKDRKRRYESASAMAADVQRYLQDEPVEACPPAKLYLLKKFTERNRSLVALLAVSLAGLLISIAALSWGMHRASVERDRAEAANLNAQQSAKEAKKAADKESKARKEEAKQREYAEKAVKDSDAVQDFLVYDVLGQASSTIQDNNGYAPKPVLTVREALDRAAEKALSRFSGSRRSHWQILFYLGTIFGNLDDYETAEKLFRRAVDLGRKEGDQNSAWVRPAETALAALLVKKGQYNAAIPILERLLDSSHHTSNNPQHWLAKAYSHTGQHEEAIRIAREWYELRLKESGANNVETLTAQNGLANAYSLAGRFKEALALFESSYETLVRTRGHEDILTPIAANNLAFAYSDVGRHDEAKKLCSEAIILKSQIYGDEHPETITTRYMFTKILIKAEEPETAAAFADQALKQAENTLEDSHRIRIRATHEKAHVDESMGLILAAAERIDQVLTAYNNSGGLSTDQGLAARADLGRCLSQIGHHKRAIELLEHVVPELEQFYGPTHEKRSKTRTDLANAYRRSGDGKRAREVLSALLTTLQKELPADDPRLLEAQANLAIQEYELIGADDSLAKLEDIYERAKEERRLRFVGAELAHIYLDFDQPEKALLQLHANIVLSRRELPTEGVLLASELLEVARGLIQLKNWGEAETLARESLSIREKHLHDTWMVAEAQATLGAALLGQEQLDEAEPLLLAGGHGLLEQAEEVPFDDKPRINESLQRLVQFYQARGDTEQADQWREKLGTAQRAKEFARAQDDAD
ncbi:serine/threonine-protein kinase [Bythopirellula polymerisocia]|nr:serine/threonine-protein kinase [Bythopirellula polymerisocia]